MRMRVVVAALALASLTACRSDLVNLEYSYVPDTESHYVMAATARASWNIGGPGRGSYSVTFDVTERVESVDTSGAVVTVELQPIDTEENGLPSPGTERRSFSLRVGPNGEVLEVLEVNGVPAVALDNDQLALIGTYRPPLPLEEVRLRDRWRSEQQVRLGSVFQEIATNGELTGYRTRDGHDVAVLSYEGEGPLAWRTTLQQGKAKLEGSAITSTRAELDIEGGVLRNATSSTSGDFNVTVQGSRGGAPINGVLHLDLDLTLTAAP